MRVCALSNNKRPVSSRRFFISGARLMYSAEPTHDAVLAVRLHHVQSDVLGWVGLRDVLERKVGACECRLTDKKGIGDVVEDVIDAGDVHVAETDLAGVAVDDFLEETG